MAADEEYTAGPDDLEATLADMDDELADQRATALRASLQDYDLDDEDDVRRCDPGGTMLEDPVRNHDDVGVAHTWWERRAGDDLDLGKCLETVG